MLLLHALPHRNARLHNELSPSTCPNPLQPYTLKPTKLDSASPASEVSEAEGDTRSCEDSFRPSSPYLPQGHHEAPLLKVYGTSGLGFEVSGDLLGAGLQETILIK